MERYASRPDSLRPAQAKRKIFGVGMFKTGTTTFGRAMARLGLRAAWTFWPLAPGLASYFDLDTRRFVPFHAEIRQRADVLDCLADSPWLFLYRELAHWYPTSRFVLTLRKDALTLAESDLAMWRRNGLMERWLREVGSPPTVAMFVERYERHNEAVARHFAHEPDRLLTICWETEREPWVRLCRFVGTPVPPDPFPHENRARVAPRPPG